MQEHAEGIHARPATQCPVCGRAVGESEELCPDCGTRLTPSGSGDGEEAARELWPIEARQGRLGRPVFMVLVASLVLALLIVGGLTLATIVTDISEIDPAEPTTPAPATDQGSENSPNPTLGN